MTTIRRLSAVIDTVGVGRLSISGVEGSEGSVGNVLVLALSCITLAHLSGSVKDEVNGTE